MNKKQKSNFEVLRRIVNTNYYVSDRVREARRAGFEVKVHPMPYKGVGEVKKTMEGYLFQLSMAVGKDSMADVAVIPIN